MRIAPALLFAFAALAGCLDDGGDLAPSPRGGGPDAAGQDDGPAEASGAAPGPSGAAPTPTPEEPSDEPDGPEEPEGGSGGSGGGSSEGGPDGGETGGQESPDEPVIEATAHEEPVWGSVDGWLYPGAPAPGCTYNFLYTSHRVDGGIDYYIGTAAHCTETVGQVMERPGNGRIGIVVFDSDLTDAFPGVDPGVDFTLVLLDEGINLAATPKMKNADGPTGIATVEDVGLGDLSLHHGYAMVFGDLEPTRDREGYVAYFGDQEYCIEGPIWWGDSGGPVLHADTGKALGIVSGAGWIWCPNLVPSQLMGPTVAWAIAEAAKAGFELDLATWTP